MGWCWSIVISLNSSFLQNWSKTGLATKNIPRLNNREKKRVRNCLELWFAAPDVTFFTCPVTLFLGSLLLDSAPPLPPTQSLGSAFGTYWKIWLSWLLRIIVCFSFSQLMRIKAVHPLTELRHLFKNCKICSIRHHVSTGNIVMSKTDKISASVELIF